MAEKQCPEGKILNPKTNRCVDINGKLGQSILKMTAKPSAKPASPPKPSSPKSEKPASTPSLPKIEKLEISEKKKPENIIKLSVSFAEKDKVKAMGARWLPAEKTWWVNDTPENREKFKAWMPKDEEAYKEAKIWIRAPWRDMENNALQCGLKNKTWTQLYMKYCDYFEELFTIRGVPYALDSYTLDNDLDKKTARIKKIYENLQQNAFNRVDLALLISNCIISHFSYEELEKPSFREGRDLTSIRQLAETLVYKYYDEKTPKIPYTPTVGKIAIYMTDADINMFDQLAGKWKEHLPNNIKKYPYNTLITTRPE